MGLTNLDHESLEGKGVVVKHDTTNVSDDLAKGAGDHTRGEPPTPPSEAQVGMDDSNDGKEGQQSDVGGQRRAVLVDGPLNRARVEVAGGIGAESDHTGRKFVGHC